MGDFSITDRTAFRRAVRGLGIAAVVATLVSTTACSSVDPSASDSASPTATVTATATATAPTSTSSDTGATPTPTTSPTPTASGSPFALSDPDTWTISGDEVGPIALGGSTSAEVDDLRAAYTRDSSGCPASPATSFWHREASPGLIVEDRDGTVTGVEIGGPQTTATSVTGPETSAGTGVGSSLAELKAAHPDLAALPSASSGEQAAVPTTWTIDAGSRHITFQLGRDGEHVALVWVGQQAAPPYEFCG
ncbi:hypothetical protein DEI97_008590 [Curtobacterium sp. MCLR17_032]|uniref:hypothetical protein n=1 Tax=Curtobacterium sp. MCLR17_032 TaxID=2175650 RepID=UPI000DAA14C7|nr:hypothetical protein [Curtobacterium sp. MCLR17_032]WIE63184.1 hypothetical protein DEI97_008590 [Curtobacterium sp. MCLR17_032]